MVYVTNSDIYFHVVCSNGTFKVFREEFVNYKDEFIGTFEQCCNYCENKVREINEALIF